MCCALACTCDARLIHGCLIASLALILSPLFFFIMASMNSFASFEILSHVGDGNCSGSWMIIRFFSARFGWSNGRRPESRKKARTPIA